MTCNESQSFKKIASLFFTLHSPYRIVLFSQETYKVKRVIDGDTIELENGEKVRLIGIDTPETLPPSKEVEYFGKEAGDFTKRMVEGKHVKLEFDVQKRDKYGRLLAYVYLEDSTFLNAELLKQGYATISTYPPNIKYVEEFARLQREAQENNRGLWKTRNAEKQQFPLSHPRHKMTP